MKGASHEVAADIRSSDGLTRKFLLRLGDGQTIETVAMGYPGRFTVCVSTQAGCAMGCVFCATGQMGFSRHLRPGEIVAQVLHARDALAEDGKSGLRNLVLMGMGEPLHNYDSVLAALEIISDTRGLNIGPAKITISTVGVVPGILRLAEEKRGYKLAVSLHGATDAERSALVPAGKRWPLDELIAACRTAARKHSAASFSSGRSSPARTTRPRRRCARRTPRGTRCARESHPAESDRRIFRQRDFGRSGDGIPARAEGRGHPEHSPAATRIDVAAGCGQLRTERGRNVIAGAPA